MITNLLKLDLQLGIHESCFILMYEDELTDSKKLGFASGLNDYMQAHGYRKSTPERALGALNGPRAEIMTDSMLVPVFDEANAFSELMIMPEQGDPISVGVNSLIIFNESGALVELSTFAEFLAEQVASTDIEDEDEPVELVTQINEDEPVVAHEVNVPVEQVDEVTDQDKDISDDQSQTTSESQNPFVLSNRYHYEQRAYTDEELDALLTGLAEKGPSTLLDHAIELSRYLNDLQLNKTHLFIGNELVKNGYSDFDIFRVTIQIKLNSDGTLLLGYGDKKYNYLPDASIDIKSTPIKSLTLIIQRNFYFGDAVNAIEPLSKSKHKPIINNDDEESPSINL